MYHLSLGGKGSLLWFLVVGRFSGYRLLGLGWGCFKKFSLLRCIRSSFGSVTFEAVAICAVIFLSLVLGDYRCFSLSGDA